MAEQERHQGTDEENYWSVLLRETGHTRKERVNKDLLDCICHTL